MKVGLFGLGHLGKIHLRCLRETPFELVGIYDPAYLEKSAQEKFSGENFLTDPTVLLDSSEACIIAAPTQEHFQIAQKAITMGKHCFIEKPITATVAEAEQLELLLKDNSGLVTQIGFVERYNPAYRYLLPDIRNPRFIEVHRLAQFNNRGNDVSVVYDLMIHDLDLLLTMKDCPIKEVKATGVKVFTETLDICNSRIEFEDGSVANLTASRMSMKVMRKFRIFQEQSYLSMDLHKKESQVINLSDSPSSDSMEIAIGDKSKHLAIKSSGTLDGNAIVQELTDFYNCIVNKKKSSANISSAVRTTKLAQQIEDIAMQSTNYL